MIVSYCGALPQLIGSFWDRAGAGGVSGEAGSDASHADTAAMSSPESREAMRAMQSGAAALRTPLFHVPICAAM